MRQIGKMLQIAGLVVLPCACLLELQNSLGRSSGLATMLLLTLFGALSFVLGRYVEGYARS